MIVYSCKNMKYLEDCFEYRTICVSEPLSPSRYLLLYSQSASVSSELMFGVDTSEDFADIQKKYIDLNIDLVRVFYETRCDKII